MIIRIPPPPRVRRGGYRILFKTFYIFHFIRFLERKRSAFYQRIDCTSADKMRTSNSGKGIITAVCVVSVQKPRFPAALLQNQQTRRRTVRYVVRVWGSGRMQYPLFRHKARGIASSARIKGDEVGGTTFKTYRKNGASCAAPAVLPLYGMFFHDPEKRRFYHRAGCVQYSF